MWVDYWGGGGAEGMLIPLQNYGAPLSSYVYVNVNTVMCDRTWNLKQNKTKQKKTIKKT